MTRDELIQAIAAYAEEAQGDQMTALHELLLDAERVRVRAALEANGWNLAKASAALGQEGKSKLQMALRGRLQDLDELRKALGPKDRRREKSSCT